jgi:succinyl-CoA synthetase beta subunit
VVKAQVLAGGRGKAGGIKFSKTPDELKRAVEELLGMAIETAQTREGLKVEKILVEEMVPHREEYYLAVIMDRTNRGPVVIFSTSGGMEIEEVASEDPEAVVTIPFHPLTGYLHYRFRNALGDRIKEQGDLAALSRLAEKCCRLMEETDALMVEINPLVRKDDGGWMALDAKMEIDDNALYRHPEFARRYLASLTDPVEKKAARAGVSYIRLEGKIGCLVNGAGLAMATMDAIVEVGGNPANFLDVGGGVDLEGVEKALKILTSDDQVEGILVNIFGGIVRCDIIAQALTAVIPKIKKPLPMVVRLEGTKRDEALDILKDSGLRLELASTMKEAAEKIVALTGGRK